ncbi:uncharacterized protein LTHEOB_12807 [Lasiodiplodia theobromae]|uniref:uncharacterized protein n=1 Tax=Lasiodiplodia theobromae TaxID=45133 RepID=UPI0015C3EC5D|nr:uncharacterized protein LTHEOB_12807 [Lasiodiplodia theobromae]KAF4535118.1 hypothetical protein LTHEOB_12807 [Lasiodiplodia theobromae]
MLRVRPPTPALPSILHFILVPRNCAAMSTENSQESPAVMYHQALRSFHRRELGLLAARRVVNNTLPLHYELYPAQNRVVLSVTLESTSQHENSQEDRSIQRAGRISQHEAPGQSALPQSRAPNSAARPNAPSSVKKRNLRGATFAADDYIHDIRVAAQPDSSVESYLDCFHKDDTELIFPGNYEPSQTSYGLPQPSATSYGPPQDAHLQHAGAGQGGFGLHTPFPPPSAFREFPFSHYHPAQHTD